MSGDSRASSYPETWEFEFSDAIRTVYVQRQLYIERGLAEILLDTLVGRLERVDNCQRILE
jgi:hypothetical protein